MTNTQLLEELAQARARRDHLSQAIKGAVSDVEYGFIEKLLIEAEEDVDQLLNELNYRMNDEPKGSWSKLATWSPRHD